MEDILFTLSIIDLRSFLNYISTDKTKHLLFKNRLRPRLYNHIIKPLMSVVPKNKDADTPYQF